MEQADACIQRQDLAAAEHWLIYYLNRFRWILNVRMRYISYL